MNRRDFLKFLGGAAAAAVVAPKALAETLESPCPSGAQGIPGPTGLQGCMSPVGPQGPGFIVLEPGMSVQEAIDTLPKEGGTVYLPNGTYITSQEITVPEGVRMVGEGDVTIAYCIFKAEPRSHNDSPIVFLMEEDEDQVELTQNIFYGGPVPHWFEVPIGDHLAALKGKMDRLYQKAKQLII